MTIPRDNSVKYAALAASLVAATEAHASFVRATENALAARAACGTTPSDGATVAPRKGK